jgi:hypothetical protein
MNRDKTNLILKIVLVIVLSVSFSVLGHAVISCNWSDAAYGGTDSDTDGKRVIGGYGIESYIIEGAGYCIAANISIQKMLYTVELQGNAGMTGEAFKDDLENAIFNIRQAISTYDLLVWTAEVTPYNPEIIEKLIAFDYYRYYWNHDINYSIYSSVQYFLERGNVTGIYRRSRLRMQKILELLDLINDQIIAGQYPVIDYFWRINEKSSEGSIFGSYVARIFKAII